jgi:UDP-N-acetylglucosamine--N-acetylmuramyl-(pentapeptide) pyrophosphoryl-undecaprenol N-acetylglucosamine transferase
MRVIIAGGGTGGHLFPGIAIAQEFLRKDQRAQILFVGTERGIEKRVIPKSRFPLETISAFGLRGLPLWKKALSFSRIPVALIQSFKILRRFRPDLVVGVGGFASGPVVITAFLMGIKNAIHEQNADAGSTNKILGLMADKIFVSHEKTLSQFPNRKVSFTGNPVRSEFIQRFRSNTCKASKLKSGSRFCILIFGGSQGARSINRSAVDALSYLEDLQSDLEFVIQTGINDLQWVERAVNETGFQAAVHPFIHDMAGSYEQADLVICRAGATTIAELTLCGRPALLIPYPFAIGDHQRHNAEVLKRAGAAEIISDKELSGPALARSIRRLYLDHTGLRDMGRKAWELGRPEAADQIVNECLNLFRDCRLPVRTTYGADELTKLRLKQTS